MFAPLLTSRALSLPIVIILGSCFTLGTAKIRPKGWILRDSDVKIEIDFEVNFNLVHSQRWHIASWNAFFLCTFHLASWPGYSSSIPLWVAFFMYQFCVSVFILCRLVLCM